MRRWSKQRNPWQAITDSQHPTTKPRLPGSLSPAEVYELQW